MRDDRTQLWPQPSAVIVSPGKVLDYIDGTTQRTETPEEYVRQEIAKSLVREYAYPKSDISVEFTLRSGSRRPRADLVIFDHGAPHAQSNAQIIVECKSDKTKSNANKDGVGQLHSYMASCPNVTRGMWTNGIERFCYKRVERNGTISFEEVTDLPSRLGPSADAERPRFATLRAASSDALLFAFRRCHNYIAGNQGLQKSEAFWELLKVIFCKIHDERTSDEVLFFVTSKERPSLSGRLKAKARLDRLFGDVQSEYPSIFRSTDTIELNLEVAAFIATQLQGYSLLQSDVDVKGRAYEEVVGSNLRGDRGEFFTPRNICKMAVAMLDPAENELLLDPACGTGGFLITAMNHVINKIRAAEVAKWGDIAHAQAAIRQRIQRFASRYVVGLDLNPNLVRATKMNMVMNNDGAGGLYQANSLKTPATWGDRLRARELLGTVDILFTNPPFGSKIRIDDPAILETFDLGHVWNYVAAADQWVKTGALQRSQPPEILFIERCVRFLKPGSGRCAIVLPDGILGSPGLGYVREWILRNTRILASIDLHPDTFQPHVGVQTSILILQRKRQDQIALECAAGHINDYDVFMALADHIGHDKRGNTTYVRDDRGNEVVEGVEETIADYDGEVPVYKRQLMRRKVVDDNTKQVAEVFREWLYQNS